MSQEFRDLYYYSGCASATGIIIATPCGICCQEEKRNLSGTWSITKSTLFRFLEEQMGHKVAMVKNRI